MNYRYSLLIDLLSDTAFGRGDGIGAVIDNEVEHDRRTGLPFIRGRTIKGLIVEACADVLFSIKQAYGEQPNLEDMAGTLFGKPGSKRSDNGILRFGNAHLPLAVQQRVQSNITKERFTPLQVLDALTTIRYQTAIDPSIESAKQRSLRATRVVMRSTSFSTTLHSQRALSDDEIAFLCVCINTVHRAGLSRSRGLGRIKMTLESDAYQQDKVDYFVNNLRG